MCYLRACLLGPGMLPYLRTIDPGSCAPASENRPEGSGKDAWGRGRGGGDALAGGREPPCRRGSWGSRRLQGVSPPGSQAPGTRPALGSSPACKLE